MDIGIYSQIALGLPLTAMQASSRHPSHRVRRGFLGHSSICVSFRIVVQQICCQIRWPGSYSCLLDLSSPGKFQVGLPRASKAHGRSALAFFFFRPVNKSGFEDRPRLVVEQQNIYMAFGKSLSVLPNANANANGTFTSINGVD
jgi:hypothetical protein